jgi:hypothetical protein
MPKLPSDIKFVEQADQPIRMRFTRDQTLISDYKKLRERLYKIDPRFVGFRMFGEHEVENYDRPDDQMLILHDERHCYGAVCIHISTPEHPIILDLEKDILPPPGEQRFSLRRSFPAMELDRYAYAELSHMLLDPSLRKGNAVRHIIRCALERFIEYRVRYMFTFSDALRTRFYKQVYKGLDVECIIDKNLDIPMRPEYEGHKMYLIHADMKKFHITPHDPDASALLSPRSDFQFD